MTKRLFGIVLMMMLMTTLSLKVYAGSVTVKGGIANGTVAVDKTTANPGETVTITVTPANGFYAEKSDVKAEKTIDGGSAQAPGLKAGNPGVGSFVDIQGDAPADISGVATYTFTMPEAPYGVQVSAEFHECTPLTEAMFNSIAEQEFSGQQITPAVQCADGYNLVLGTDYTVEYGENVGPGMNAGTVTIIGKNKYTGTALLYFTIFRETYEIRWGQGNPWDSQHVIAMTKGADGKWVAADQEMAATSEFKVVKKREAGETTDTWYGAPGNDNYWINAGTLNTEIQLYEGNQNLYFPNSGTYTFTFDPATNKLVVSGEIIYNVTVADGIQNGTVVASPTSGKAGDPITITATANPGYKLQHLYINGEQVSATDNEDGTYTYNLTMPAADVTVGAEFSRKLFNITKAQTENGSFDISMTSGFIGDEVEIYPSPADGYIVDQVTVTAQDGTPVQVDNWVDRYHFVMPASDVTVAVTFRALTISYEIHWGITPEGSTSWAEDHVIPMTKRDDGGWVAINQALPDRSEFKVVKKSQDGDNAPVYTWYGAQADNMYWITPDKLGFEIQLGSEQGYNNLYFPDGGNFTFNFNPINNRLAVTGSVMYDITYSVGPGGTVTADKTQAAAQEEVTVTVTPDPGYEIDVLKIVYEGLMPNGTPTGLHYEAPIENGHFSMPAADVQIYATFKLKDYTITLLGGQPAHATVTVPATAHLGEEVTVNVETELGYEVELMQYTFEVILPDGTPTGMHNTNTIENGKFTMPAADVTLSVTIKKIDYTITVAQTQNGTVEAPATANYGDEVTLTVTPASGYELETLTYTVEGGETVVIENNKFIMPAANVTINATFKETVVEYHYSAVEQVKCTVVDASGFAPEGQTITMRVVPDSDTQFKEAHVYKVSGHAPNLVEEPIEFTVTPVEGSTKDVDLSFVMPAGEVEAHVICADAYSITVNFGDHGSAQADKIVAIAGETVTVTTYPNQDYKVDEIYYTYTVDGTSNRVDIENGDNGYTFTMPAADVLVVVTFKTIFNYYKLNFDGAPAGGTVSVEANGTAVNPMDDVAELSQVKVTVTPAEDYEIESFRVVEGLDGLWGGGDPMIEEGVEPNRNDGDEVPYDIISGVYNFMMPSNDATIIVAFKAIEHTYTIAGQPAVLFGSEHGWEIENPNADMTLGADGIYTWTSQPTYLEGDVVFKILQDHSYDVSYPSGNYVINAPKPGTYTVTITLNPATGEITVNLEGQADVYVIGSINGTTFTPNEGVKMTSEDGKIYTATVNITDTEGGYSFFAFTHKLGTDADDWYTANAYRFLAQSNGNFIVTGPTMNVELQMEYNGDNSMKIPAGDYTLTVDIENMKLTIAGGTQLSYILANGYEGIDYTVINDLAVVENHVGTEQLFTSDGNDNWITIACGPFIDDAIDMEALKGGHVSGVFTGKNLNPYLMLTALTGEGEDVASVEPKTYLLAEEFTPKVDEVIIVSKAYYKASDNALRAYAPGGHQGQSCTVDNSLYSYDFQDGKAYTVKGVINIKEPWTTTGGKGLLDYDYPFQNYKLLVTDVTEEDTPTSINGIFIEEGVKSVRYYNAAGVESNVPFQGVNIVVKEMIDGTKVTTKAIIK